MKSLELNYIELNILNFHRCEAYTRGVALTDMTSSSKTWTSLYLVPTLGSEQECSTDVDARLCQ